MRPVIVVTRPEQQAKPLCERLQEHEFEVFCCPTLEILSLEDPTQLREIMAQIENYHLVIFVSPNAIEHALEYRQQPWPVTTAIGVMGPGSTAVLTQYEITAPFYRIITPQGKVAEHARFDSESLLEQLDLHQQELLTVPLTQARVLILRGTEGRDLIVEQLRRRGTEVDVVACYQRHMPRLELDEQAQWRSFAAQKRPLLLSITSSEGLRNLVILMTKLLNPKDLPWLKQQLILASHPRIIEQAHELGFNHMQIVGAGDDNLVQHISELIPMTESTNPTPEEQLPSFDEVSRYLHKFNWMHWLLLIAAILLVIQFFWSRHQMDTLQREVARRTQETQTISRESQSSSQMTQDLTRDLQNRIALLETTLAQFRSQQAALDQLYQELSRTRDEWALSEIEQILSVASQQLQLAGNIQGAIIALQTADARLARVDRAQFVPLRRIFAHDLERLKTLPYVDVIGLAAKLDSVINNVGNLPAISDAKRLPVIEKKPASKVATDTRKKSDKTEASLWQSFKASFIQNRNEIYDEFKDLIQVRRVDNNDALYLTPEQIVNVRENIKLRLLNARLALLSHQEATYRADIRYASEAIEKYFDKQQKSVQATLMTLQQLQGAIVSIDFPVLNDSLNAVRNYRPLHIEEK